MDSSLELQTKKPAPAQPSREAKKPTTDVARRTSFVADRDLEAFYADVPCTD
jgi:hypothetical protein